MCCHPIFAVPLTEHGQSRHSVILNNSRIFGVINEHWLQLKSPAALAPNKRGSLSFEALKPGIHFPTLAVKLSGVTFFHQKAVLSTLEICCSAQPPFSLGLLGNSLLAAASVVHQHLLFHVALSCYEDKTFP